MKTQEFTNKLVNESSPYLLQHAHNPVEWYPWGEEALRKAVEEDKPILVSIGYSACHWCHVMEKESFEDEIVARLMNAHFICIKIDREERPDVDQIYMDAVQAMGLQGGWPLNVFLTSDQKPFYGGTYFPKETWKQLLNNVAEAYAHKRADLVDSAEKFTEALNYSDVQKYRLSEEGESIQQQDTDSMVEKLSQNFDANKGGMNKAPKFPMPGIWNFMLHYLSVRPTASVQDQLSLTLDKMAAGGIYDQIGGGFSRYSVDDSWFAPHFEKMLYDNGQLISLYAKAYRLIKKENYKKIVYQTLDWVEREMTSAEGGFYAALDADSEGEEGKFYTWTSEEFHEVLGDEAEIMADFYGVAPGGNWEKNWNILHHRHSVSDFAKRYDLDQSTFEDLVNNANEKLFSAREKRIRPGLDDKILTGWNGIMLKGIIDAYVSFGEPRFLNMALKNANFIKNKLFHSNNTLWRTYKNGKASLSGYLEDYAYIINAFTALYQITFEEEWLNAADRLATYTLSNFYDEKEKLFFYTDSNTEQLIARKKEIFDNVIPSSNSIMAQNLYEMGTILDRPSWRETAEAMVLKVNKLITAEPQYMNTWATVYLSMAYPTAEVAVIGSESKEIPVAIGSKHIFNVLFSGTETESFLPLLKKRTALDGKTTIYVCYGRACKLPVHSIEEALEQISF